MHGRATILAAVAALSLTACAGGGFDFSDPVNDVIALDAGYHAFCGIKGHEAACSKANQQKEQDAYNVALAGAQAYDACNLSQEQLDALIQDLANLVRDFESRK